MAKFQPVGFKNVIMHLGYVFEDYYELKKNNLYVGECACGNYLPLGYRHSKCPWCIQNEIINCNE